jgi:hypothetical protein
MARNITVPAPVTALNPITKKPIPKVEFDADGKVKSESPDDPWTMYRFLVTCVFVRPEWEKPLSRARTAHTLLAKFDGAPEGTKVEVADEQWRHLRDTIDADDFALPKHFGHQLVVFADAILDATNVG